MNVYNPPKQIFIDVGGLLLCNEGFLEKDLYVSLILHVLADLDISPYRLVFGGGTSLLKAHKVITRFSEDIDFQLCYHGKEPSRTERRKIRTVILHTVNKIEGLNAKASDVLSRDSSRFFSVDISYPKMFSHSSLRPGIKLECRFSSCAHLNVSPKTVSPLINPYYDTGLLTDIDCLDIDITCADKISALVWRVLSNKKERKDKASKDGTYMRHLYDIASIINYKSVDSEALMAKASSIYDHDKLRANELPDELDLALAQVIDLFSTETGYEKDYDLFVMTMCFGTSNNPTFREALEYLSSLMQ